MESGHKFMLNDILRKKRKSKMRKPECPVFLTYGPTHVSPLRWIKRWKEDIICIHLKTYFLKSLHFGNFKNSVLKWVTKME